VNAFAGAMPNIKTAAVAAPANVVTLLPIAHSPVSRNCPTLLRNQIRLLWQFPAHCFGDNQSKAVIRTAHWLPGIVDVAGHACELAQTPNYFGRAFAWRNVLEGLSVLIAVLITLDAISIASCLIALQMV
jgi:hypothetical protein